MEGIKSRDGGVLPVLEVSCAVWYDLPWLQQLNACKELAVNFKIHELANPIHLDSTGVVRVGATRVTLETVIGSFLSGESPEEIADSFPALSIGEVYSSIAYYLEHRGDVDEYLADQARKGDEVRQEIHRRNPPKALRERLLSRMAARQKNAV